MTKTDDVPLSRAAVATIKSVVNNFSQGVSFFIPAIAIMAAIIIIAGFRTTGQAEESDQELDLASPDQVVQSLEAIKEYTPYIEEDLEKLEVNLSFEPHFLTKPILVETVASQEKNDVPEREATKYVAQKGDTLSSIANKYDLKLATIKFINNIEKDAVNPGDKIKIPENDVPDEVIKKAEDKKRQTEARKRALAAASKRSVVYRNEGDTRGATSGSNGFKWPVGVRGQNGYHWWAADIGPEGGTNIHAAKSGTVTVADGAGYNGGYGKYVKINHHDGTETLYAHLSSVSVGQGQYVSQGETVGAMGSTGRSTATHLHFEIEENGQKVNPLKYY